MSDDNARLASIAAQFENEQSGKGLPPVEKWNPAFSGDLDMVIKRDGSWFYLGSPILRPALVRLFSTILKREEDDYFLVTPVEKFRITVEDAPFVVINFESRDSDGTKLLEFETQVGDKIIADKQHPVRVDVDPASGEPSPYLLVRNNLEALISRNVFYRLVDSADVVAEYGMERLYVRSAGERFLLGSI